MRWRRRTISDEVADFAVRLARHPEAKIPEAIRPEVVKVASGIREAWALATAHANDPSRVHALDVAKAAEKTLVGFRDPAPVVQDAMARQGMNFLGPFAPGQPLTPLLPDQVAGRTYDYTVGENLLITPRDGRVPFDTLEDLAERYDIAQACVRYIIRDLLSMPLLFEPADETTEDVSKAIEEAKDFWAAPDGIRTWHEWFTVFMRGVLTLDAAPVAIHRNAKGKIIGLRNIDGKTIIPKITFYGERPLPPAPAFQQIIEGVPFENFDADALLYPLMWPRVDSVYGMPPLESVLLTANTDLRMQAFWLQFFTSGAVPEVLLIAPEEADTLTLDRLRESWDRVMNGDPTKRYGAVFLPGGTKVESTTLPTYPVDLWNILMRLTVQQFGLNPINLGFTEDVNRATAGTQMDLQERVGTFFYTEWVSARLTQWTQELLGLPVKLRFDTGRDKKDRYHEAETWRVYIQAGIASPDEARRILLGEDVDPTQMVPRFVVAGQSVVPVSQIMAASGNIDPRTAAPTAPPAPEAFIWPGQQQPNPAAPATPVPSVPPEVLEQRAMPDYGPVPGMQAQPTGASTVRTPTTKASDQQGRAASILLFARGRVFIQRRKPNSGDVAQGLWEFPGGHVEPGETPWDAAVREWQEETGILWPSTARTVGEIGAPSDDGLSAGWTGFIAVIHDPALVNPSNGRVVPQIEDSGDPVAFTWASAKQFRDMKNLLRPGNRTDLVQNTVAEWCHRTAWLTNAQRAELAQLDTLATIHWQRHAQKPWRFTWSHFSPEFGRELEAGVLKAEEEEPNDQKIRPTELGPDAQRLEEVLAEAIHQLNVLGVDTDDLQAIIAEHLPPAIGAQSGDVLIRAWARTVAEQVPLRLEPLQRVLGEGIRAAVELGVDEAGVRVGFDQVQQTLIQPAMTLLADRPARTIESIRGTLLNMVTDDIAKGIERGEGVGEIAARIETKVNSYSRAKLIATTEVAHAMTRAAAVTYTALGVEQWDLLIEATACPVCRAIHATNPHPITDLAILPPEHPQCRCAMAPAGRGYEQLDEQERQRRLARLEERRASYGDAYGRILSAARPEDNDWAATLRGERPLPKVEG